MTKVEKCKGFTLIELLLVMVVVGLLSSTGIYTFVRYNQSRIFNNAVNDVVTMLNVAKSRAVSQVKPAGCTGLIGYKVKFTNGKDYSLYVVCGNAAELSFPGEFQKTTPDRIDFLPASKEFIFIVMTGDVNIPGGGSRQITISGYGMQKIVRACKNGRITIDGPNCT